MKGRFSGDHMLVVVPFLFALSASVSIFIHLDGLMSASRFPPGVGAALHYKAIAHGWTAGNLASQEAILHSFISFTMYVFDLDLFTAIRLTSMLITSLLPLSTYLLASTVTENQLIGVVSAWLVAFMPVATAPPMVGNYGLTFGLVFFVAYLAFLVKYLKKSSIRTLLLVLFAEALTVLVNVNSTLLMFPVLMVLSFFALQRKVGVAPKRLVSLSLLSIALPLLILSAFGSPLQAQDPVFWVNPALWTEDLWLTLTLAISTVVGIYTLLKRVESGVLSVLLVSALISLASAFTPVLSSLHALSPPILALLAASPLLWLRESVSVSEVEANEGNSDSENEDGPVVEVVIDLPRFAPILLVIILAVSTVGVGYNASAQIYDKNSFSGYFTYEEITSAAEWIDGNTPRDGVLSARPDVAAWLEALSGRRSVGFRGQSEALISETIRSTSFRIMTPSLLVDEWEPFSTLKAPCLSYYDGRGYSQIAYIDDGLSGAKMVKDGGKRVERLFRSAYGGYRWLSDSPPEVVLVQYFETSGLFFEKTIKVSTAEPRFSVKYRIDPKPDVELIGFDLFLRVEPWEKMRTLNKTFNEIVLTVGGKETKISFSGNIVNLRHDEYDEHLAITVPEFKPTNGVIEAEVSVSIKSEDRSQMPLWVAHTPDLLRSHGIEYVVAKSRRRSFLDMTLSGPVEYLVIRDSFNRVLFYDERGICVEAPCNSTVLFDKSPADGVRVIGCETDSLLVNKTLTEREKSIEIRYAIAPRKSQLSLISMNLTVWIDWDIPLLSHTIAWDTVRLNLSYGELEVRFIGCPIHIEVGSDPRLNQNRVQAVLMFPVEGGEVGVNISSLKPLLFEYEAAASSSMEGDSQLTIYVNPNILTEVFKQDRLVVCRVNS